MAIEQTKEQREAAIRATGVVPVGSLPPPPVAPEPKKTPRGEQTPAQRKKAFEDAGVGPVTITPSTTGTSMTTQDLTKGTQLPDASAYAKATETAPLSDAVSQVAQKTLTATGAAIDTLMKQREADVAAKKEAAKGKVDEVTGEIKELGEEQAVAAQDTLEETRKKFEVDKNIEDLQTIQTKIASAQEALEMGLIYEADRPTRMSLILGRSASLQKQGLASIGALQATAQILQGNLDLADSYAQTTIDAIVTDNKNAMDALNKLLELHNDNLVDLTDEEKTILDDRIKALQDQDAEIQTNSQEVFDLMSKYPSAALAGGVTLLDDRATALQKMLPKMSAMEMEKYNADITKKLSTKTDKDGPAEDKQQLLGLKDSGMSYEEALNAFSDTLSTDWINDVYREAAPKARTPEQQIEDAYYQSFIDPETGGVKEGFDVTMDEKGRPVIKEKKVKGETTWWKPQTWF